MSSDHGNGAPAARAPAKPVASRGRGFLVGSIITLATLLAVVGMHAVWADRLLFNPDNWEETSTQLLANPDIRDTTANYVVDELYANTDVTAILRKGLPPRLQPLAGPAAGALRGAAERAVEAALNRPRVQDLWATANRAADQAFIAVVEGGNGPVTAQNGVVILDLGAIVQDAADRLGLPAGVSDKLPPDVAQLTILRSDQLGAVQDIGDIIRHLALWLTILVPLLYGGAILLASGRRRRTLMTVGFSMVVAGLIGMAGRSLLKSQVTESLVNDEALRPAVRATIGIGTQILGEIAGAFVLIGLAAVAAAWFAGPAHAATAARRALAPTLRDRPALAFATTTAIMLLVFLIDPIPATSKPGGIIVLLALALLGTEVLRRQTAEEFPDAQAGDTAAGLRARMDAFRERRAARAPAPAPAPAQPVPQSIPGQLAQLATLREKGAITSDEYDNAKSKLLHV